MASYGSMAVSPLQLLSILIRHKRVSLAICPRVVSLGEAHSSTVRVPVRVCNLSAGPIKIRPRSNLCRLNEVKVIDSVESGTAQTSLGQTNTTTHDTVSTDVHDTDFSLCDLGGQDQ